MATVPHAQTPVHITLPFEEDAWRAHDPSLHKVPEWDAVRSGLASWLPEPDGVAWLRSLANERHSEESDPSGVLALAASAMLDLVRDMRFHKSRTVTDYVNNPNTRPTMAALVNLTVPPEGHRVSGFAAALDRLAEEYLRLHTAAGGLAAWAVEDVAHEVETYGSANLAEYEIDEAAFRAACHAAGL
jgi:hypothetical protein